MIPKQELEAILENGHFELNTAGIKIAKSHIELYELLDVVETELAESSLELMRLYQAISNG